MANPTIVTKVIPKKIDKYDDDVKYNYLIVFNRAYKMFGSNKIAEVISDAVLAIRYDGKLSTNKKNKKDGDTKSGEVDYNPVEGTPYVPPAGGKGDSPST